MRGRIQRCLRLPISRDKTGGRGRIFLATGFSILVSAFEFPARDGIVDRPVHAPAVGHGLDGDHEARRERAGQERGGVEADDVGGVKGVQAEACACTDRMSVYAHRSTLASSASDGRHELRAGLRFARCQRRRRCTTADVLNESAGTGSQAHVTTRR